MRFAFLLALLACGDDMAEPAPAVPVEPTAETAPGAFARVEGVAGDQDVRGTVRFEPRQGGMWVRAELTGLEPGPHGFHVHEHGSCADAAEAAGGHFAPEGEPHGPPTAEKRHVGDLGNLEADATGRVVYERLDAELVLDGPKSIVGRAIVVHAAADDLSTQPSGGSGGRIACGVIERAQPGT